MLPIEECAFNQLMTKNVPHILEIILFSLDYKSFANCRKVSNTWRALLTSKSFQKKANSIYIQERVRCEKKLMKCSDAAKVYHLLSIPCFPINNFFVHSRDRNPWNTTRSRFLLTVESPTCQTHLRPCTHQS